MSERAWLVYNRAYADEGCACVVFASTRGQAKARARGAPYGEAMWDCEYTDIVARRAPDFDDLAGRVPEPADYLARGWWWACSGCRGEADGRAYYGVDAAGYVYCEECARERGLTLQTSRQELKEATA